MLPKASSLCLRRLIHAILSTWHFDIVSTHLCVPGKAKAIEVVEARIPLADEAPEVLVELLLLVTLQFHVGRLLPQILGDGRRRLFLEKTAASEAVRRWRGRRCRACRRGAMRCLSLSRDAGAGRESPRSGVWLALRRGAENITGGGLGFRVTAI